MAIVPFTALPDSARIWVFGATQPVLGHDAEILLSGVEAFLRGWLAHGQPVIGACDWRYDHFLLIGADEEASGVSGCSVDALYHTLRELEQRLGVTLLDTSAVWYRDTGDIIQSVTRPEFRELIARGDVRETTIVFDNTVGRVRGVRNGEWERPLRASWHGRAFGSIGN